MIESLGWLFLVIPVGLAFAAGAIAGARRAQWDGVVTVRLPNERGIEMYTLDRDEPWLLIDHDVVVEEGPRDQIPDTVHCRWSVSGAPPMCRDCGHRRTQHNEAGCAAGDERSGYRSPCPCDRPFGLVPR